jgi:tripartite-type tricarboxylate transporter receptor subunit TctC
MWKQLGKRGTFVFTILLSIVFLCPPIQGADFPKKTIKLVVTAGVGGGEDSEARGIAPYLEKHLGVKIIIDSQPGAGGKIAFEKFQKTEPNGYTLITYTFPKSIVIENTDKVNFRTKDFVPIYTWSYADQVIVVNAETWKTFDEFLRAAKTKTMTGGISGGHSTLSGLAAADELGLKVNWIPYEGSGGSLAAVAGKHIDFMVTLSSSAVPLMEAGKLKALALFGNERDPYLPNVPCTKELGVKITPIPGIRGLSAPPKTPQPIVGVIAEACGKAIKESGFVDYAKKRKMAIRPLSGAEYGNAIAKAYPMVEKYKDILTR